MFLTILGAVVLVLITLVTAVGGVFLVVRFESLVGYFVTIVGSAVGLSSLVSFLTAGLVFWVALLFVPITIAAIFLFAGIVVGIWRLFELLFD